MFFIEVLKYMKKAKNILLIAVLLITFGLWGCDPSQECVDVKKAYVDFYIYPNSTEYQELNAINGWVHLTAPNPSKGIIVYRYSHNLFMAYERTCPHDKNNPHAIVSVDEKTGMFAKDTICNTRYIITDGYPLDGPGICPLTQYKTSFDGERLRIYSY